MPAILHTPRIAAPALLSPAPPLDAPQLTDLRYGQIDNSSFHALLAGAIKLYEELSKRSWSLEAENRRLEVELAHIRQSAMLPGDAPRPDSSPVALNPVAFTPRVNFSQNGSFSENGCSSPNGSSRRSSKDKSGRISTHSKNKSVRITECSTDVAATGPSYQDNAEISPKRHSSRKTSISSEAGCRSTDSENLVWSGSEISEDPNMLMQPGMTEEEKLEARKTHEIRVKFHRLDHERTGHIPSQLLEEMVNKDEKQGLINANPSPVTCLDVIKAVSSFLGEEETSMTYPTFHALLTIEDIDDCFSEDVCKKITQIRTVFARDDMRKAVAGLAHVGEEDLEINVRDHRGFLILKYLDICSFSAIMLNVFLLGAQTDVYSEWSGWEIMEYGFTAFFLLELIIKVKLLGLEKFLFGGDAVWNCMDSVIVFVAMVDTILSIVQNASNMQFFTMLRLVRLARITRLVRLLRFKFFKELLLMIRGVFAGMRTLLWAIVLLSLFVFMLGIILRQTFGRWCSEENQSEDPTLCTQAQLQEHGEALFSTLARSCLTVFRCFTDGCSAPDGTPLVVHIFEDSDYGPVIVFIYVISFLFVTFGLFNLIMAIFVENTMESAKFDERKRQQLQRMQAVQVAQKLQRLVLKFCTTSTSAQRVVNRCDSMTDENQGLRKRFFDLFRAKQNADEETEITPIGLEVEISRDTFSNVVADPQVWRVLEDLEVAVNDPMDLFDTLDADGSGTIDVSEMIKGLLKLRGTAEKSDMVACLLAVRAIQKSISGFEAKLTLSHNSIIEGQDKLDNMDIQICLLDKCLQQVVPGYHEHMKLLTEERMEASMSA